jgi:hypothetical protein
MVRLSAEELASLDAWISDQKEKLGIELSRPAAIRTRLAQSAIATPTAESAAAKPRRPAKKSEP